MDRFRLWRACPTRFVIDALDATPDPWQAEALTHLAEKPATFEAYRDVFVWLQNWYEAHDLKDQYEIGKKRWTVKNLRRNFKDPFGRVSVRSAHGVGKSTAMAWSGLWFVCTHFPCKIPCTAPTSHQLQDVLWAEMAMWYRRMPEFLRAQFTLSKERIEMASRPEESFVVARTARREQPEALQGFHSDNILFLIDEASGVFDPIFEVAEGALTSENARVLMCANPTRTQGYFYNSHHAARHLWHTMKVSAYDSPRVSEKSIESYRVQYGEGNVFRVRVLGEFPTADDDAVIPLYLCESAVGRKVEATEAPIVWGIDVGRFGSDRSALAKRQGNQLLEPIKWWAKKSTMETVGITVQEWKDAPPLSRPEEILVDVIGLGAGVVDRLRENGLPVIGVNVAESPAIKEKYFRQRDELWFSARDWFDELDCCLPDGCDELIAELVQPRYVLTSTGKLQVESKADVKKRTLNNRSPDLADAFILTFASQRVRRFARQIEYPRYRYV